MTTKAITLALTLIDLGLSVYRRANDKARRRYRRVQKRNHYKAALKYGDADRLAGWFDRNRW